MTKDLDVVIFGAYGFTGKLIVKYFTENINLQDVNWAIAGRSKGQLLELKKEMMETFKKNTDFQVIVASVSDEKSLDDMLSRTQILINCVGPFSLYSPPVLASCVKNKTHYLDITGEPQYVKYMFDEYSESAKKSQVLMVPCCGIDSIPADLGVYYTLKKTKEFSKMNDKKWDAVGKNDGIQVEVFVKVSEKPSYGTWNTLVTMLNDRYSCCFGSRKTLKSKKGKSVVTSKLLKRYKPSVHYNSDVSSFVLPFPTSDPLIIKYSSDLLEYYNGAYFSFGNYLVSGLFSMIFLFIAVFLILIFVQFPFGKDLLIWLGHKKGKGPAQDEVKDTFEVKCVATLKDKDGSQKLITSTKLPDAGYLATAKYVSECALCVLDLIEKKTITYGVQTTASAFGDHLLSRLEKIGYVWKVESNKFK